MKQDAGIADKKHEFINHLHAAKVNFQKCFNVHKILFYYFLFEKKKQM